MLDVAKFKNLAVKANKIMIEKIGQEDEWENVPTECAIMEDPVKHPAYQEMLTERIDMEVQSGEMGELQPSSLRLLGLAGTTTNHSEGGATSGERENTLLTQNWFEVGIETKVKTDVNEETLFQINQFQDLNLNLSVAIDVEYLASAQRNLAVLNSSADDIQHSILSLKNTVNQLSCEIFSSQVDGNPGDATSDDDSDSTTFANDTSVSDESFTFANSDLEDLDPGCRFLADPLPSILFKKETNQSREPQAPPTLASLINCSSGCYSKCGNKCMIWPESDFQKIRELFQGRKSVELKNKLLSYLLYQKTAGLPSTGFFFNNHLLCANYLCHITSISKYYVTTVLKDFSRGRLRYIHANQNKCVTTAKSVTFVCWMTAFSEKYGQQGPSDIVTVLPSYLNKRELHKIYKNEAPTPHVTYSTFCRLLKTRFGPRRDDKSLPWVRFSSVSTHSKCDTCLGLDKYQRECKNKAELAYCESLKKQHMILYGGSRIAVGNFIQRGKSNPEEVFCLQIDSMDNSKSIIPRILDKSKAMTFAHRLPCKITACITSNSLYPKNRKVDIFINHGKYIYGPIKC